MVGYFMFPWALLVAWLCTAYSGGVVTADSWEGVWAFDKDWCQYSDQIGEHDPAPIRITRDEFVGLENWCTVIQHNEVVGEIVLDLACEGEGIPYSDRVYLRVEGDSLNIRRTGEEATVFRRCGE
jgi:hypothetical protein